MTVLMPSPAPPVASPARPAIDTAVSTLSPARLARAKRAFTTRNVEPHGDGWHLLTGASPRAGDLVLARVTEIGQHTRIERPDGRRATLFPGDEVIVAYGDRYAPDQFEAFVPPDLGPCHLAAAGGVAGRIVAAHESMDEPTALEPLGLLADEAGRISLARSAVVRRPHAGGARRPATVAVAGTAMNSGKTTAAAWLVRGLAAQGVRVGAAKVTGTGSGGDLWLMEDAGAHQVLDFTDAGYATTYGVPVPALVEVFQRLTGQLAHAGAEVVVVEIADGLFQPDTAGLLAAPEIHAGLDMTLFAASDALGAAAGVQQLRALGYTVPAVSGRITLAPLAVREAEACLDIPVLSPFALGMADVAAQAVGVAQ